MVLINVAGVCDTRISNIDSILHAFSVLASARAPDASNKQQTHSFRYYFCGRWRLLCSATTFDNAAYPSKIPNEVIIAWCVCVLVYFVASTKCHICVQLFIIGIYLFNPIVSFPFTSECVVIAMSRVQTHKHNCIRIELQLEPRVFWVSLSGCPHRVRLILI